MQPVWTDMRLDTDETTKSMWWYWYLNRVFIKIRSESHFLWLAVD